MAPGVVRRFRANCRADCGLRLNGPRFTGEVVSRLVDRPHLWDSLRLLDLAGAAVGDDALRHVESCRRLVRLDLRDTQVTMRALDRLGAWKHLEELHLGNTRIRWWQRWRLAFRFRPLSIVTSADTRLSSEPKARFSSVAEMATVR